MKSITWRAVLLGLILIPINAYWLVLIETVYYSAHSTTIGFFFNPIFTLLLLIGLNTPLKKLSRKFALKQGELLTVYIMVCQASALVGHSMLQILVPTIAAPVGLATPENEWQDLFWRYMPSWLIVTDERALEGFVVGFRETASLYTPGYLSAWIVPVIAWSGFIIVLMFVMICIDVIIRKQWTERERLTYPVAQLPYEMTNRASGLFRNKLMWTSFTIVGLINVINGLHFFFPAIPYLRVKVYNLGEVFTTQPWDALGYTPITLRPYCIGMLFLVPLDINFSCWFFFILWKSLLIIGSMMGYRRGTDLPEIGNPALAAGAYLSVFFIALWVGRHHFTRVLKSIFNLAKAEDRIDDKTEPMRYRTAVLGLVIGFVLILLFCWKAGMLMWAACVFFVLYLMTAISVTRMRAEVGSPIHDLHFSGPETIMIDVTGVRKIGPKTLSIIPFFWFLTRAHYSDPMPHQLEGINLGDRARIKGSGVVSAILVATIVGTLVGFWVLLHTGYRYRSAGFGQESFNRLQNWLTYSIPPDMTGTGLFAYGLLFGIFLMFMRTQFLWWPLHPVGYAVSSTYSMRDWWSMFFLTWLIKRIILSVGGLKMYRKVIPLFFGLILGDFAVGSFWSILGIIIKKPTFNFTQWW